MSLSKTVNDFYNKDPLFQVYDRNFRLFFSAISQTELKDAYQVISGMSIQSGGSTDDTMRTLSITIGDNKDLEKASRAIKFSIRMNHHGQHFYDIEHRVRNGRDVLEKSSTLTNIFTAKRALFETVDRDHGHESANIAMSERTRNRLRGCFKQKKLLDVLKAA